MQTRVMEKRRLATYGNKKPHSFLAAGFEEYCVRTNEHPSDLTGRKQKVRKQAELVHGKSPDY